MPFVVLAWIVVGGVGRVGRVGDVAGRSEESCDAGCKARHDR